MVQDLSVPCANFWCQNPKLAGTRFCAKCDPSHKRMKEWVANRSTKVVYMCTLCRTKVVHELHLLCHPSRALLIEEAGIVFKEGIIVECRAAEHQRGDEPR